MEHAAASSPPPTDTPSRGRGRGRGKGRGKRKSLAKTKALAAVKKLVPTGRRGRIKQYSDPRVQAAYERQREVKTAYLSIISHVKPALEELASRNIEKLKKDSNAHKAVPEHDIVKNQLDAKLTEVTGHADKVLETQLGLIERSHEKNTEFQNMQYEVGVYFPSIPLHLHLLPLRHPRPIFRVYTNVVLSCVKILRILCLHALSLISFPLPYS